MGLDMYLRAKCRLSDERRESVIVGLKIPAALELREIVCDAAYWRKANMIHLWLVEHVQDGEDNCAAYDVAHNDLHALAILCRAALHDRKKAAKLLPTTAGFFFGSTDYDEYYFQELERTADELEALLLACPEGSGWGFEYQSSW